MTKLYTFHFLVELIAAVFWSCWAATFLVTGNTVADTALILASFFLAQAIFEVPTGYWADRYGRKLFSVSGLALVGLGFAFVGFSKSVPGFVTGFFISGLGITAMSGAKTSWLLGLAAEKSRSRLTTEEDKKHFFLNLHLVGRLATIVGAFGGVELLKAYPDKFWIIVGVLAVVFSLFGMAVEDGKKAKTESEEERFKLSQLLHEIRRPALALAVASILFFGIENGIRNLIYQPFILEISGGNKIYLAYFQAILAVLRLGGILVYMGLKLAKKHRLSIPLLIFPLLWFGISEIISARLDSFWIFVAIYGSAVFCLGWFFPLREQYFNSIVPERLRATLISFDSMVMNLASATTLVGLYGSIQGSVRSLWVLSGSALIVSSLALLGSEGKNRIRN